MPNPHTYSKNSLLGCIETLNKVANITPPIRVRTKALPQVLSKTAEALKEVNHYQLTENTPQEVLEEMVCWGLLDIGFLGEEVSEEMIAILTKFTDTTVQAPEILEFDETHLEEHMAHVDKNGKEIKGEKREDIGGEFYKAADDVDDGVKEGLTQLIAELTQDLAKAEKKGKTKKIAKITTALDEAKAKLMDMKEPEVAQEEEEPEPEPKPKAEKKKTTQPTNPRIKEINEEIKILKEFMPEKKKKAKKQLEKINVLELELADIWDKSAGMQDAEPTEKKKKTKTKTKAEGASPTRGVNARASRPIPSTITWPKPDSITGTIVSFCQKKPRTIPEILGKLEKAFPDRPIAGMTKTVGALVGGKGLPLPLHYSKGIPCEVENDGTPEKTIFIPESE